VYNEVENLGRLYAELRDALDATGRSWEAIFIDDGSSDGSGAELARLAAADGRVKIIEFRRNFGQTAALRAGIEASAGDVIVTLDGDLQNDPADIPRLLARIDEGYDLVHGWRKQRRDTFLTRTLPSRLANWLISRATGFAIHDLGCSLKAIRRDVARELDLHGEMHRFVPILAHWRGARSIEIETHHRPRRFGRSKYGLSRVPRVLLDLLTVKYFVQHLTSPMKLFGTIGMLCGLVSLLAGAATVYMKAAHAVDMTGNPLLLLSVFSTMVGVQFVGLGMLGELGARMYYAIRERQPYAVRRTINCDRPALIRLREERDDGNAARERPAMVPLERTRRRAA
ncbi:MAG TPA: glycosyltransferase family 2 protein, partial [Planctomycetaceae bacterium]|nr:glycosyltransferase family 2 protein [Planctomycetaceae bacterium]